MRKLLAAVLVLIGACTKPVPPCDAVALDVATRYGVAGSTMYEYVIPYVGQVLVFVDGFYTTVVGMSYEDSKERIDIGEPDERFTCMIDGKDFILEVKRHSNAQEQI